MRLSERIRHARRVAQLSQDQLAGLVGVQRSAVSNWESASRVKPSMANLAAVAEKTNVSLEWLGTGRGPMHLRHDPLLDVPTADAELVDSPQECELLRLFRSLGNRAQILTIDLLRELVDRRGLGKKEKLRLGS